MRFNEDAMRTREQLLALNFDAFKYLDSCPYYYYILEHNICVLHGGLEKNVRPENQLEKIICRVRNLDTITGKMVSLNNIKPEHPFWTEIYEQCGAYAGTIVYGHAPALEPRITKNTYGIDTVTGR